MMRAGVAHAEALALIHGQAFPTAGRWSPVAIRLQLAQHGAFGWIDATGGMVLARVVADESEVLTLAVVPAARRRGLGRRLLRAAMAEAVGRGAAHVFLEVACGNVEARALYGGAGFVEVGRRREYYAGGEDALIMKVALL